MCPSVATGGATSKLLLLVKAIGLSFYFSAISCQPRFANVGTNDGNSIATTERNTLPVKGG